MSSLSVDLYRSVRKDDFPDGVIVNRKAVQGVLYPDFFDRRYKDHAGKNRTRRADVVVEKGLIQTGGGTSLFDKINVFSGRAWLSFAVPLGTTVPPSILIRETHFNEALGATHHQIEVRNPMTIDAFKGALDNLARNAVVKAVENAGGEQ